MSGQPRLPGTIQQSPYGTVTAYDYVKQHHSSQLGFNCTATVDSDLRVRQAVRDTINLSTIADFFSEALQGLTHWSAAVPVTLFMMEWPYATS